MTGLNSPHGRRGSICAHFHWTYDYLLHGIPWGTVQRMLIDAPRYDTEGSGDGITEQYDARDNPEDFIAAINRMIN